MIELNDIKKNDLEEYTFPGTDAAVLVVNKKVSQQELEKSFEELDCQLRLYPTDTGWKVKFPYWFVEEMLSENEFEIKLEDFEREERGWDHEHCSFCNDLVAIGDSSYTCPHEDGGFYIICMECSKKCK